jgi:hypothetical protein
MKREATAGAGARARLAITDSLQSPGSTPPRFRRQPRVQPAEGAGNPRTTLSVSLDQIRFMSPTLLSIAAWWLPPPGQLT